MTEDNNKSKDKHKEPPKPEVLRPKSDKKDADDEPKSPTPNTDRRLRRLTYKPSHKATFVGLAVVVVILVINAGVILYLMQSQGSSLFSANKAEVTISSEVLDQLGVSRNTVGVSDAELVVNPRASFNGTVTMGSDVSIAGQLNLNNKLLSADASLTKLDAGDVTIEQLNVNGDSTISNLNLREGLIVVGTTQLQGSVTISQLLTANSINVANNLSVGGTLSAQTFHASNLTSDTTLTIGGHIITRGSAPGVSPGSALGNNGTVSISGSDAAGTVAVNIGTGGGDGILAYVSFNQSYSSIPRVVVTLVGQSDGSLYIYRSATGFTIGHNAPLSPGGYAVDYIVMQ
jgi:hypothetical protein